MCPHCRTLEDLHCTFKEGFQPSCMTYEFCLEKQPPLEGFISWSWGRFSLGRLVRPHIRNPRTLPFSFDEVMEHLHTLGGPLGANVAHWSHIHPSLEGTSFSLGIFSPWSLYMWLDHIILCVYLCTSRNMAIPSKICSWITFSRLFLVMDVHRIWSLF
jgi:hypothetical protein